MAFGVTDEGFVIKDLQTIKSELEADFKNSYGNDLDVSADSVTGQLIGNMSKKLADMWELAQTIYNYFSPDYAVGESLDQAAALVGAIRLPAVSTEVIVALYGNLGTVIPVGHLLSQEDTEEQFSLKTAVTIALTSVLDIDFSVSSVLDNTTYTVTINSNAITYTSDATATEAEIIAGLVAAITASSEPVIAQDNFSTTGDARVYANDGETAFSITVDANLQVDAQASPGTYNAVNTGALSVPANTLNTIVVPIAGLDSANNLEAGTTGRNVETDEQFRIRRRRDLGGIGRSTEEAIRARILQEVADVISCSVVSNRTDSTVDGRPPHSFEAIVTGGDEQEIAENIWENAPAGIEIFGNITKTVVDSTGKSQTVKFSRPTDVYIWMDIEISLYLEESFPSNGVDAVKDAIYNWSLTEYAVGVDVIRQRINIPIYEVPGISDIGITLAKTYTLTPPGSYVADNIEINDDEIALADQTRMTVTIV